MTQTALAPYTALGTIAAVAAVLVGLWHGLGSAGWSAHQRRAPVGLVGLVLGIWLGATVVLAWLGAYRGGPSRLPVLPIAMLLPVLVGGLLIRYSPAAWRVVEAVPQQWLVGVQVLRVIGGVFVVLWAAGSLPGVFALPAGFGDLATGVLAPFVALAYTRRPEHNVAAVRRWNMLGITDLIVAFATGAVTTPRLAPLLGLDTPSTPIDAFPLLLIPAFAVPLFAVLHIASLAKLRDAAGSAAGRLASRRRRDPNHCGASIQ